MTAGFLVATIAAIGLIGLVLLAGASATRSLWAGQPSLAPAYGLLVLGPVAMVSWGSWLAGPVPGAVVSWLVVLVCAGHLARRGVRADPRDLLHGLRTGLPVATLALGLLFASLGMLTLWQSDLDPFSLAAVRFSHPLPIDGRIPALVADRLLDGSDPRTAVPDWHSSDRPPLQIGLLLLVHGIVGRVVPVVDVDAAASVVSQSTWVLGAWSVTRVVGMSPRSSALAVVGVGVSGSLLVNTVFTWPKLLSAAFVLAAVAIAVHDRRNDTGRTRLPEVAVLVVSGLLSHGAAVFAIPIVALCLGRPTRRLARATPAAAASAAVLYGPWLVYQRFYDPPGDRLLSWHLAGVVQPTDASFLDDLVKAYGDLDWHTLLGNKLANLALPFGTAPWQDISGDWAPHTLRATQFFTVSGALAFSWVPLIAITTWMLVGGARRRMDALGRDTGFVALACLVSLLFWALLMFGPGTTYVHQGSHVPIILLGVLPTAWAADRLPVVALASVLGQVALTAVLYAPPDGAAGVTGNIDPYALVVLVLALLALAACVQLLDGPGAPRASAGTTSAQPDSTEDTRPLLPAHRGAPPREPSPQGRPTAPEHGADLTGRGRHHAEPGGTRPPFP